MEAGREILQDLNCDPVTHGALRGKSWSGR
jgi:hypothetical protein